MAEAKAKKPNFFKKIGKFFSDVVTVNNTLAVTVIVVICAVVIVALDLAFGGILELLINLIAG